MKKSLFILPVLLVSSVFAKGGGGSPQRIEYNRGPLLAVVSHHWEAVIVESNYVSVRPGSVYDIRTYFEQRAGLKTPTFNYIFHDTGLGAADPIYPTFQSGYQARWSQLIKAGFSEHRRHIDHYSKNLTPEGCLALSTYWVRHINEFPNKYHDLRKKGFTLIDIGFDHYLRLRPDAQCGRHKSFAPDANFDPIKEISKYASTFSSLDDIPKELLEKYEAKIGVLRLVTEEFGRRKWPRYSALYSLEANSLWYYPNGFEIDHGVKEVRTHAKEIQSKASDYLIAGEMKNIRGEKLKDLVTLEDVLSKANFNKYLEHIQGRPVAGFKSEEEPGEDTLDINTITPKFLYSVGTRPIPITDVKADVTPMKNYDLVGVVTRPYEPNGKDIIPQVRFIFQLKSPENKKEHVEQLFLHVIFNMTDHLQFLNDYQSFVAMKTVSPETFVDVFSDYLKGVVAKKKIDSLNYSSALTGVWIFGTLTTTQNKQGLLEANKIIKAGIDLGYYSSAWDNTIFRQKAKLAKGEEKKKLLAHLNALIPADYRDAKREDVHAVTFERMSCAQCHQFSGRDGVHFSFNDKLDRRVEHHPYRASKYTLLEIDRQLIENKNLLDK